MREGVLYGSLAMFIGLRMLMLFRSWRLPSTLVPGKFFWSPVGRFNETAALAKVPPTHPDRLCRRITDRTGHLVLVGSR